MPSIDQRAREAIADIVGRTQQIPKFAAVVMVDGRTVLEHNAAEPLCACSTFKVAAATAMMALAQEGTISLDRPVLEYDPTLSFSDTAAAREITLRRLLSHTSGLDDTELVEPRPRQCLERLPFVARPGRAFRYSNVAFDIAVLTAAQRAGLSCEELLRSRVLRPLSMNDTHWRPGFSFSAPFTTGRDLMRLAEEHLGANRVLQPHSLAEMHRVHADSFTAGPCRYYGLGIDIERWANGTLLAHGGGLAPFGTAFVIDPDQRAAVALLFDNPMGYKVSPHALLDRILDRTSLPEKPRANTTNWDAYLGRYSNGAELSRVSDRLSIRWKGKQHLLEPIDERLFASRDGVSVGILKGTPAMISVNDFILIGAQPGVLLEDRQ
jgi:CubicO group peptidase (beta-lactamase class C family)